MEVRVEEGPNPKTAMEELSSSSTGEKSGNDTNNTVTVSDDGEEKNDQVISEETEDQKNGDTEDKIPGSEESKNELGKNTSENQEPEKLSADDVERILEPKPEKKMKKKETQKGGNKGYGKEPKMKKEQIKAKKEVQANNSEELTATSDLTEYGGESGAQIAGPDPLHATKEPSNDLDHEPTDETSIEVNQEYKDPMNQDGVDENLDDSKMPRIEDAGNGRFLKEILEQEKLKQRDVFQQLIDDKTQAEMKCKSAQEKLDEVKVENTKVEKELKKEKNRTGDLKKEIQKIKAEEENRKNRFKENDDLYFEMTERNKSLEVKVTDLQLRLKNLLEDDSEKDTQVESLKLEVNTLQKTLALLKDHVHGEVYNDITMQAELEMRDSPVPKLRGHVVDDESKTQSKICSIM